jgi:riboflavin synthase
MVAGHVDGVGRIVDMRDEAQSRLFLVETPKELARFIARKGSVALDGISLTLNAVSLSRFGISIIPHTLTHTTLGARKPGDRVNLEVDLIARYVARLIDIDRAAVPAGSPWWQPMAPYFDPEESD